MHGGGQGFESPRLHSKDGLVPGLLQCRGEDPPEVTPTGGDQYPHTTSLKRCGLDLDTPYSPFQLYPNPGAAKYA